VVFGDGEAVADDDEAFGLAGLEVHGLLQALIDPGLAALQAAETAGEVADNHEAGHRVQGPALAAPDLRAVITAQVARFQRAGQLPMAEQGRRAAQDLVHIGVGLFDAWGELQALYPLPAPRQPLRFAAAGLQLDDWLTPLRCAPGAPAAPVWLQLSPSRLCSDPAKRTLRRELLIPVWIGLLAAAACGVPVRAVLVGRDASVTLDAPPQADAAALLQTLMQAWRDGMASPLPLAARTALALLAGGDAVGVYEGRSFPRGAAPAEGDEPCLARAYPDFESLVADGRFVAAAEALFGPMLRWIDDHATVRLHAEPGTTSDEANAAEVAHG
jgi:exodeoxyribonuclease V gamma subunit